MRGPCLVLLFALCLPLQAGDPADLNSAVEMFRSPRPAVRAEGSRLADKQLRKLLAPLLKAMKDQDPEVRRRVREAILGLVPNHGREPETQKERVNRFALAQLQALKVFGRHQRGYALSTTLYDEPLSLGDHAGHELREPPLGL